MTFQELQIPTFLTEALKKQKIDTPTPIQVQSIPVALQGRDILASSPTGSGKTLAYLLPLVINLLNTEQTTALILTPTRELAAQVRDTLSKLSSNSALNSALLIGGEDITKQFLQLKRKPRIIIGTPGRVVDHLQRKTLTLDLTSFLVLDETDRMLEMGFSDDLEYILSHIKVKEYQTFMFSATLPPFIVQLAEKYLNNPERVLLGKNVAVAPQITQVPIYVQGKEKFNRLLTELSEREGTIIVFVKTKVGAEELAFKLREYDHKVEALHGDLRQHKRDRAIRAFRSQKCRIMVATDVASRGIDIPHIQCVINYDIPQCAEDYEHRIGRTGRAGASGHAVSFISSSEVSQWKMITKTKYSESTMPKHTRPDSRKSPSSTRGGKASGPWQKRNADERNFDGRRNASGRDFSERRSSLRDLGERNFWERRNSGERAFGERRDTRERRFGLEQRSIDSFSKRDSKSRNSIPKSNKDKKVRRFYS